MLGAWLCGAAVSVADPGLGVAVVRAQLEDTRARLVVVDREAAPRYVEANSQVRPAAPTPPSARATACSTWG